MGHLLTNLGPKFEAAHGGIVLDLVWLFASKLAQRAVLLGYHIRHRLSQLTSRSSL